MAKTLTFCDPIHGFIAFRGEEVSLVQNIIQTPLFQRLRYIKQLGLSDLLFPCAVHTRFSHSLGVCFTAKRMFERLTGEASGTLSHEKSLLMQAALLHDIGHGPFSHAFEEFVNHTNKNLRHDQHWLDAALKHLDIDPEVIGIIKRQNPKHAYLSDLVSSQLDADRMDYLLRDSHFCGVTYGQFEMDWLINSLEIAEVEDEGVFNRRVCVNVKGISALEHFIMARRLMKRYVYTHANTLAADHLLINFLQNLASALFNIDRYTAQLRDELNQLIKTPLGRLLIAIETASEDEFAFAEKYFVEYQRLVDDDIRTAIRALAVINDGADVCQIAERLYLRNMPQTLPVNVNHFAEVAQLIKEYLNDHQEIKPWQLALHCQNFSSYQSRSKDKLYLAGTNETASVDQESNMLSLLGNQVEDSCYLFIDKAISEHIDTFVSQMKKL